MEQMWSIDPALAQSMYEGDCTDEEVRSGQTATLTGSVKSEKLSLGSYPSDDPTKVTRLH